MTTIDTTTETTTATTEAADLPAGNETPDPAAKRGPIVRIVLASLLTGIIGAAVATLVIFAGAPEHDITGSALLAFAAGWAMLAALSTRLTSQPQRWAYLPAAVMAVTGLGLMLLEPDNSVLTDSGWVWPPVMVTLAGWMWVQMRRALSGRVRWLLYPVIGLLTVASIGAFAETIQLRNDMEMPGTRYDIGGRSLHMHCTGTGSPTVVLESGMSEMSSNWALIASDVSETTRVCAYDRAGQGWSDDANAPADGQAVAHDLHALLAAADVAGPVVLVGHSTGGVYAMTYAAQYPSEVAGLVLLDSSTPYQFDLPDYPGVYRMLRSGYGVAQSIARLGVGLLIPDSVMSSLPSPAGEQVASFATSPRGMRNVRDELAALPAAFDQAKALRSFGEKPLAVVTATGSLHETNGWATAQNRLAALSANSVHQIIDASHNGLLADPHGAAASASAIAVVVRAVRAATAGN